MIGRFTKTVCILTIGLGLLVVTPAVAAEGQDESMTSLGIQRPAPGAAGSRQAYYTATLDSTGAAYSWIDATVGTAIPGAEGDDTIGQVTWPFAFQVYDDMYDSPDVIDVNSNGSLHFDQGGPRTLWVNCGDVPSDIDGQWVAPLGDDLNATVPPGGGVWWLVTGTAPNRILTIEWAAVAEFSGGGVADLQVNLYETTNKIVTQVRITTPFAFLGDGVGGINAGDAIVGEEVVCASTLLPSNEWDVEYAWVVPVELQSFSIE